MAYLNLDLDYFDHPKVVRLVGQLGRGADLLPVRLWCYCGKYHADTGDLIGYSPLEIESAIKWWGQPGRAVETLTLMGFLDHDENGYKVHDWAKINGHIAALKARAVAGAAARWAKERAEAQAMLKHSSSIAGSNAPTVHPSVHKENTSGTPPAAGALGGKPKGKPKPEFDPKSVAYEAARFMWEYVREWSPQAIEPTEAGYQAWARDCDLMFRKDGRTPEAFNELLDWIDNRKESKDGFSWRKNVLCPATLRKRWQEGKFADFLPSELAREEFK